MPLSFAVLTATKTSLGKQGSFPDAKRNGDGLSPPLLSPDNEPFRLALGNNRGGGLALTNKASAQTQASHDQNQRKCNFLHGPSPVYGRKGEHLLLRTTSAGKTQWMDSTYPSLCRLADTIAFWQGGPHATCRADIEDRTDAVI